VRTGVSERIDTNLRTIQGNLSNARHAAFAPPQHHSSQSLPWGCIFWIAILVIGGISSLFTHSPGTVTNPNSSSGASQISPNPSNNDGSNTQSIEPATSSPESDPQTTHLANLQRRYDALRTDIESERPKIDAEQIRLTAEKTELEAQREKIESNKSLLDTTDPQALAAYNAAVDNFNAHKNDYNSQVRHASKNLKAFNKKVNDLNEITGELNAHGR
jgi:hypothetical protein